MNKIKLSILILFSIILLIFVTNIFIGFPFSYITYLSSYNQNNFPYLICPDSEICKVKKGQIFAHEWLSNINDTCNRTSRLNQQKSKLAPNYSFSANVIDLKKKVRIKQGMSLGSCVIKYYDLFRIDKSGEEHFYAKNPMYPVQPQQFYNISKILVSE